MRKQPEEGKHQGGSSVPLRKEEEITLKARYTKGYFCSEEIRKGLLVQIKEKEVFKVLTNKEFTV